jgi:hypothetical protein
VFDRISTFSDETAGDYSRLARLDERNLRVGPKAEEVFLPGTWAATAEKPRFASVRPHAQGQPIPIREQIGRSRGLATRNTTSDFGSTRLGMAWHLDSVYTQKSSMPPVRDSRRRKQKTP